MDLEAKYGHKFKIFMDDAYKAEVAPKIQDKWRFLELRGKYGYAYPYDVRRLAVAVNGGKIVAKVVKQHSTWKIVQDADDVTVFLIEEEDTQAALSYIKLFRKKTMSDENKAKLKARLDKYRAEKKAAAQ